jgi:hypothetical protein
MDFTNLGRYYARFGFPPAALAALKVPAMWPYESIMSKMGMTTQLVVATSVKYHNMQ